MGIVKVEDIMAYFVGQSCVVCCNCVSKEEEADAAQDEIITLSDVESGDNLYFCDRCEKQIG